jgi:hypothetical protein
MSHAVTIHQSLGKRQPAEAVPDPPISKTVAQVNNPQGGPKPPLTLLKRISTPEPQEANMDFSQMLKAAVSSLEAGDLDTAERYLDRCTTMQKADIHIHNYGNGNNGVDDDDEEVEDDWSENATKPNAKGYTKPASNNNNDDEPDDDEDGDPSYARKIYKAAADYNLPHMGNTSLPKQPSSLGAEGPSQRGDTYQLSVTPTVSAPARTSFDEHVDRIAQRDKCSRLIAQQKARVEEPASYAAFQQFSAEEPTSAQQMRRDRGMTTKAAPSVTTFEDHIAAEMSRGCSEEVAAVRTIQKHGAAALQHRMIQKRGPSITRTFAKAAGQIMEMDGISRCESLRKLRQERPDLYHALNES